MALENVPRCRHIKLNGVQCGSPALRRRRYCYFHDRMLDGKKRFSEKHLTPRPLFSMCLLEDANAVQVALMQVLQLLGSGQMDHKTAGLMLYGLQTASANVRHTSFEAQIPTDVVIDRDTVDRTCIDGPQWFEEDFEDEAEDETEEEVDAEGDDSSDDENEDESEDESNDESNDEAGEEVVVVAAEAVDEKPGKIKKQLTSAEVRAQVQGLARNWLMEAATGQAEAKPG
jgi:hypothetical protein